MSTRASLSIVFALVAACGNDAPAPRPTHAPPPSSAAAVAAAEPPSITHEQVDALVTEWQRAQNEGDFEAYARLYDARFVGVRRTTRAIFRLDHDGWIEDRRRLFQRAMRVAATDVTVLVASGSAVVHFTQRWESGGYAEEGDKRMVLVRLGDALRIASEEMLPPHEVPLGTGVIADVLPAFETDAQTLIVLGEALDAGSGTLRDAPAHFAYVALREADATIPRAYAALVGSHVQLVGSTGVCSATITSLGNAATVLPGFDVAMVWQGGDFGDGVQQPPVPLDRITREVETMAERHYWVAITEPSSCGHARAAVIGDRAPSVWPVVHRAATSEAVLALLFSGESRSGLLTRAHSMRMSGLDRLDDDTIEARLRASTVVHEWASPGRPSVIQAVVRLSDACGGYDEISYFTRTGQTLTPREIPTLEQIDEVIDADDDGTPELIMRSREGSRRIVRLGASATSLSEWRLSAFGCDC